MTGVRLTLGRVRRLARHPDRKYELVDGGLRWHLSRGSTVVPDPLEPLLRDQERRIAARRRAAAPVRAAEDVLALGRYALDV